ncbi:MAG TPA: flagellar basal body rod protein FlgB [Defluviitoga tunisiensis]|jgi:flagellar basal-body rod protein FlgB|uniref:Flagellar basal body rod protein FlgB n=1 Tax=Defluviitoga tunisiensis TaxID=1006576 RepID=A0A0C7NZ46_DEFTU|nr:flagellar basal body rod protein FlgB [Defluviitoga tunisiensis]MDD3600961.1 flagellar basal body rod protein FlgB [Defluviitoga tunisiensis]MDY0380044.1 flagellar basal body rod protein FlgB [Defluviitoga tunisiensis]CEP78558.1 flagellar basal-body rod protein FlgB [Defluviitoga tunisiensis]HHV01196.1 flagellar basal body rod protein FlgB [Defluviitoga tunisiensis]HOK15745.1 flagellar basal body rod protein FlgB [Defluviitoga tunisiensis]
MFDDINFNLIPKTLNALSLRHTVISQNISNYNTPGYKRKYVDFESELQKCISENNVLNLKTNNTKHINNTSSLEIIQATIKEDDSKSLRDDDNNVDPDKEFVSMIENTFKYNTLSRMMTYAIQRYDTAIRGGK